MFCDIEYSISCPASLSSIQSKIMAKQKKGRSEEEYSSSDSSSSSSSEELKGNLRKMLRAMTKNPALLDAMLGGIDHQKKKEKKQRKRNKSHGQKRSEYSDSVPSPVSEKRSKVKSNIGLNSRYVPGRNDNIVISVEEYNRLKAGVGGQRDPGPKYWRMGDSVGVSRNRVNPNGMSLAERAAQRTNVFNIEHEHTRRRPNIRPKQVFWVTICNKQIIRNRIKLCLGHESIAVRQGERYSRDLFIEDGQVYNPLRTNETIVLRITNFIYNFVENEEIELPNIPESVTHLMSYNEQIIYYTNFKVLVTTFRDLIYKCKYKVCEKRDVHETDLPLRKKNWSSQVVSDYDPNNHYHLNIKVILQETEGVTIEEYMSRDYMRVRRHDNVYFARSCEQPDNNYYGHSMGSGNRIPHSNIGTRERGRNGWDISRHSFASSKDFSFASEKNDPRASKDRFHVASKDRFRASSKDAASRKGPSRASLKSPSQASLKDHSRASLKDPLQASLKDPPQASLKDPPQASLKDPPQTSLKDPPQASLKDPPQAPLKDRSKGSLKHPSEASSNDASRAYSISGVCSKKGVAEYSGTRMGDDKALNDVEMLDMSLDLKGTVEYSTDTKGTKAPKGFTEKMEKIQKELAHLNKCFSMLQKTLNSDEFSLNIFKPDVNINDYVQLVFHSDTGVDWTQYCNLLEKKSKNNDYFSHQLPHIKSALKQLLIEKYESLQSDLMCGEDDDDESLSSQESRYDDGWSDVNDDTPGRQLSNFFNESKNFMSYLPSCIEFDFGLMPEFLGRSTHCLGFCPLAKNMSKWRSVVHMKLQPEYIPCKCKKTDIVPLFQHLDDMAKSCVYHKMGLYYLMHKHNVKELKDLMALRDQITKEGNK